MTPDRSGYFGQDKLIRNYSAEDNGLETKIRDMYVECQLESLQ